MKICSFKKPFGNPWSNWRICLAKIAGLVINNHLYGLTRPDRARALVLDDSLYDRDRCSKVELLAWVKDHTKGITKRGFHMLALGWTDGVSFIPLAFSLLSSSKKKFRICEANLEIPPDSPGFACREEAVSIAMKVSIDLIDQAMKHVRCFKYVLFDSWFSWPSFILAIKNRGRDVICMLKDADTQGSWAQSFISTAAANGIVSGYYAVHFGPNDPITRKQMTAMVVRAAKLALVSGEFCRSRTRPKSPPGPREGWPLR